MPEREYKAPPETGSAPPTPGTYDEAPPEPGAPKVGETWKRRGMKERVLIGRVWTICGCDSLVMHGFNPDHDACKVGAVRCHPRHGGRWWWTMVPEFLARFDREDDDA